MPETGFSPLSLRDIASWSLPNLFKSDADSDASIRAALPALQRAAVWKPDQTEKLWDSLAQGFPIGSFLVTEYDEKRGQRRYITQEADIDNPTHHLLDGQQRATAIARGFINPWNKDPQETDFSLSIGPLLWVDLAPFSSPDERRFNFRVITRAHPWGYQSHDSSQRLSSPKIRDAIRAWKALCNIDGPPHCFPLTKVFPWDAKAPIPLCMLLEAITEHGDDHKLVARYLLGQLPKLPFWTTAVKPEQSVNGTSNFHKPPIPHFILAKKILDHSCTNEASSLTAHFQLLTQRLQAALRYLRVPALSLGETAALLNNPFNDETDPMESDGPTDPVETLFIRVNTSGTSLSAEEINYSLLKASWPDAPRIIEEDLLRDRHIARPSRLASLLTRLALADWEQDQTLPLPITVSRFRRLLATKSSGHVSFEQALKDFTIDVGHLGAKNVLNQAWLLLAQGDHALPKVLAADISQNSQDVMFLLLFWIRAMLRQNQPPIGLPEATRRQVLGFVTSLAWFSEDKTACVRVLYKALRQTPSNDIEGFFCHKNFMPLFNRQGRARYHMLPLMPPDILKEIFNRRILSPKGQDGISFSDTSSRLWREWDWWERLGETLPQHALTWYREAMGGIDERTPNEEDQVSAPYLDAWWKFLEKLTDNRNRAILLYAQRGYVNTWFDWYDPTLPDQVEDRNRPWDYDHIVPDAWIRGRRGISWLVRDWSNSIGNLRAWPMELNRSDSDWGPRFKLNELDNDSRLIQYGLDSPNAIREASFVSQKELSLWIESEPQGHEFRHRGAHWKAFVRASISRSVGLYSHWYETLLISQLMG